MHFVYKTDNLLRSTRVSYGNSCVTKGFQFFELTWTLYFLCVQNAPFKATSSIFKPFWLHLVFFMHLLKKFELYDPENEKHYKWTLKRLKVGMVSSFHPHSMCKRVERVTSKTGRTSCTNWTISFGVSRLRTRTHLLQRDFIFFELIWTPEFFCVQNASFKATSSIFNPFWLHLLFFMHLLIILTYKTMKLKSIWNELWKGSKLAWYHHFTHIACARK